MTVRDKVGRPRYVAFALVEGAPIPRPAMQGALPEWARLTRFDGARGIARCPHTRRDDLVAHLLGLTRAGRGPVRIDTLLTSGTLRGAAEAFPRGVLEKTPRRRD